MYEEEEEETEWYLCIKIVTEYRDYLSIYAADVKLQLSQIKLRINNRINSFITDFLTTLNS